MFQDSSRRSLFGVSSVSSYHSLQFEWVTRPVEGASSIAPFGCDAAPKFPRSALLYGSMTRDLEGRFYAVGTKSNKPIVLQITPR